MNNHMTDNLPTPTEDSAHLTESDLPVSFGYSRKLIPTGSRWSIRNLLIGRYSTIIKMCLLEFATLCLAACLFGNVSAPSTLVSKVSSGDRVALLGVWVALLREVVFPELPLNIAILYFIYNFRERRARPFPGADMIHELETGFHWSALLASLLGLSLFFIFLLLLGYPYAFIEECFAYIPMLRAQHESATLVVAIYEGYSLILAEKVVSAIARRTIRNDDLPQVIVSRLRAGVYDKLLPKKYLSEKRHNRLCRLIENGAALSVEGAIIASRLLDARSYLKQISEPFTKVLEAGLSIISFGSWDILVSADEEKEPDGEQSDDKDDGGANKHPRLKAFLKGLAVLIVATLLFVAAEVITRL